MVRANQRLDPVADDRIRALEQIRSHDSFVTELRGFLIPG